MARCTLAVCILFLLGASLCAANNPVAKVPKDIQQAEQLLSRWVDSFVGLTPEKVRQSLGDPTKETSWLLQDKKQPLWKYQVGPTTTMSLYFGSQGRVVKAGLHLLP